MNMRPRQSCYDFVKKWETFVPVAKHLPADPPGVFTIGWGHTGPEVEVGQKISQKDADALLERDMAAATFAVQSGVESVSTTQCQFDAMVSLCYNIGAGHFLGSTLLKMHRLGRPFAAAMEFPRWHYSAGEKRRGLIRRRFQEASLYSDERWQVTTGVVTNS